MTTWAQMEQDFKDKYKNYFRYKEIKRRTLGLP